MFHLYFLQLFFVLLPILVLLKSFNHSWSWCGSPSFENLPDSRLLSIGKLNLQQGFPELITFNPKLVYLQNLVKHLPDCFNAYFFILILSYRVFSVMFAYFRVHVVLKAKLKLWCNIRVTIHFVFQPLQPHLLW